MGVAGEEVCVGGGGGGWREKKCDRREKNISTPTSTASTGGP